MLKVLITSQPFSKLIVGCLFGLKKVHFDNLKTYVTQVRKYILRLIISNRFQIYVILNCIVQEIFLRLAIRFQSSMESTNKDFVPNGNEKNYARGTRILILTNRDKPNLWVRIGFAITIPISDFRFPQP